MTQKLTPAKAKKKFLLKFVLITHVLIVAVGFPGLFLIFIKPFQNFFIVFYLTVVGTEIIFLSDCPLTLLENKLRRELNLTYSNKYFLNKILEKVGFSLPQYLIKYTLLAYFVLTLFLINHQYHFSQILTNLIN